MTRNEILQAIVDGEEIQYLADKWIDKSYDEVLLYVGGGASPSYFRIKQKTIIVNSFQVIAGEKAELKAGEEYFLASPKDEDFHDFYTWEGDSHDRRWLERGLIHKTKENAIAHAVAMLGLNPAFVEEQS